MINSIHIENYKCIQNADVDIKPLTIVTGLNSTGKSTLVQSILLPELVQFSQIASSSNISTLYETIRSKYSRGNQNVVIRIAFEDSDKSREFIAYPTDETYQMYEFKLGEGGPSLFDDKGIYYLSASRTISNTETKMASNRILINFDGSNVFSVFDSEKNNPVIQTLQKYEVSQTLQSQLNYWLSYILEQKLEVTTEKPTDELVVIKYNSDGLKNISPSNLGTGVTYLAKVLITCLRAKQGNVVLIENPEIHLHPSAQAKLGEFLAFMVNGGIQLIVETHCEHLINRVQYAVYNHEIKHDDVTILYKGSITEPFNVIPLQTNGHFEVPFPEGFFDATLGELIEMDA